jgi:regulator of extracellular matrix RemA (YlzA/DUF370 family)
MSENNIKYAVYYLNDQNTSVDDIAKELSITAKRVKSILAKKEKPVSEKPETTKTIKPKDLIINETSGKKTKNVAIMTQSASMIADEMKKNLTATTRSDRMDETTIFRPLDNQ